MTIVNGSMRCGFRSAAFFHLKQFHSCLVDIDNAIQAGFPAASLHKLLDRRGKCHLFLKHKHPAITAFEEAKQALLTKSSLADKAKQDMISLTEQFIVKCRGLAEEGIANGTHSLEGDKNSTANNSLGNMLHEPLPKLTDASAQIPCASDCLVLKEEAGRGRGLYATRDIKVGEVLIVETPFASVVLTDHSLTHCHHCCARCFVPLPCQTCVDVVFCSWQCQSAAQAYHPAECQLMDLFHQSEVRLGHLALKMVVKAGYSYLMQQHQALEQAGQEGGLSVGCDERGVYDSENYATMYHLVGHSQDRTPQDLWSRSVMAAFLVKCLQDHTSFFPEVSDAGCGNGPRKDICCIGAHILRHLMMLPCNAHEVSEMGINWQEPSQSQTLEIGSAIYPVLSLINHSCDPSVVRHSYADRCVVRAIRGIAAGEEICDNYGALYPVMDKASRHTHLQTQYYFTCCCHACTQDWPMYMDIPKDVVHFYCDKCGGRVPVPSLSQASKTDSMECRDCRHRQNIGGLILKVGSLEQGFQDALFKVIFSLETEGDTLPRLVQFLRVVDKYVHRPVSCHNDCQEAVKMCYAYKANAFPRRNVLSSTQKR